MAHREMLLNRVEGFAAKLTVPNVIRTLQGSWSLWAFVDGRWIRVLKQSVREYPEDVIVPKRLYSSEIGSVIGDPLRNTFARRVPIAQFSVDAWVNTVTSWRWA